VRTLIRVVVALTVLASSVAHAQNLAGNWQGTLQAGQDLRLVFVIANGDANTLRATMYSIDQSPQGIPVTSIARQGATVRMSIAAIGVTFDGTLSADGNTIAGTFTQGGRPLSVTLARATTETAWALPQPPKPMAKDAPAVFEVATIKPSPPDRPGKLFTVRGRQVLTVNTSVADLMMFAYGVHTKQVTGGPAWAESDRFDITGQPEGQGLPNQDQMRSMIQKLLADRFKLAFHRETRELPVYAITVGSSGPRLTKNDTNPNGLPSLLLRGLGVLPALNATMGDFAGVMQSAILDRPVLDRTGLQGRYDFTLTWTPDETQFIGLGVRVPPPSGAADAPPGLFTAMQEQIGLKMESTRAPVEVLAIDRLEKPSEN
jgi:bla regulator protein blaR1